MTEAWQQGVLMAIPSINGGRLLARMLPTLRLDPSRIVVLDQGSTDDTAAVCAESGVELVQLGHPRTYTEACNLGADLARRRGCAYVCVANNDIVFRTDVMREMWEAMEDDPALGIVAPSQVIVDPVRGETLATQVFWRLDRVEFSHDTRPLAGLPDRLEADFCELTCALVRLSATAELGFLDDEYGFYYEDADFGFRLRMAGYGCAYLPASQILHFTSSTFVGASQRKLDYLRRNRARFTRKHLGYRLRLPVDDAPVGYGPRVVEAELLPALRRHGLLAEEGPMLRAAPLATEGEDYVHTTLDAPSPSPRRLGSLAGARAVFAASKALLPRLAAAGIAPAFHLPLAADTDVFHPWVPTIRLREEMTILVLLDAGERRSLRAILEAWRPYRDAGGAGWLVLVGHGLGTGLGAPDATFFTGEAEVARHAALRIEVHAPDGPLTAARRAVLYRGADAVLLAGCGEAPPLPAVEAMACGVPAILGNYGLHGEVAGEAALTYGPDPTMPAEAMHWSPSLDGMTDALRRLERLLPEERATLSRAGLRRVRDAFTTRHAAAALYRALPGLQERDPTRLLQRLARQRQVGLVPVGIAPAPSAGVRVARRLRTAGHLATQFGLVWEETGLRDAGLATASRVSSFVHRRAVRFRRLSEAAVHLGARKVRFTLAKRPEPLPRSVLLVGYIDGQLGLGQSLRGLALAMDRAGIPFHVRPIGLGVEGRRSVPFMSGRTDETNAHAVNIIEVTADELPNVLDHVGRPFFRQSRNILRTYWELGRAPEAWRPNLAHIHEIWAPNAFVGESFRTVFDGPITVVPPCVELSSEPLEDRAALGLEEGRRIFLFSFDYYSFPQRKNPMAVVRAFREAFDDPALPVALVVKATGAPDAHPDLRAELHAAAAYDGRITILDGSLSRHRMLSLIAACDCYVSLHRAEGFGLGMAEALALGRPVIGTAYSGNAEFVTEETGYPIPYVLRPLAPDEYVHAEGQVWAEPDEAAAIAAMRRVVANPEEAAARAEAGRRFVLHRYGPENVGRLVAARLEEIFASGKVPGDGGG